MFLKIFRTDFWQYQGFCSCFWDFLHCFIFNASLRKSIWKKPAFSLNLVDFHNPSSKWFDVEFQEAQWLSEKDKKEGFLWFEVFVTVQIF